MNLPPNRVPIAKLLARESATPETIAKALGVPEEEVTTALLWHFDRGSVERAGSVWRLTPEGREWLSQRVADKVPSAKNAKAPKAAPALAVVEAPKVELAAPASRAAKTATASAAVVRDRLTKVGLWPFVESFATANGVQAMALVSEARTQHLGRTRLRLYAALLSYPGREYSVSEVAYLCGRYPGTVRDGLVALRARESKAA